MLELFFCLSLGRGGISLLQTGRSKQFAEIVKVILRIKVSGFEVGIGRLSSRSLRRLLLRDLCRLRFIDTRFGYYKIRG